MKTDFFRGRRLRRSPGLRAMVRETRLAPEDLIMPYFVVDTPDVNFCKEITSMPGQHQLSLARLEAQASEAYAPDGIVQRAVAMLKKRWPELQIITDVCLCEYTSHGHCGLLRTGDERGEVLNDPTLELLAKTAVSHVEAGADMVAPSDMMDGRILALRQALDVAGFANTPIMAYSVKYASAFYGPFRDAAESTPQFGDRKTYQMDPGNADEALREAAADIAEGADIIMVKPAGPYQDIIRLVRDRYDHPVAAYQVSGEYAMIKAAALNGWIDEDAVVMESLLGIRRAGAKLIITYFTEDVLRKGLVR